MEYRFKQIFRKGAECEACMLSVGRMHADGETHQHCAALGSRPICVEEGCRRDCPLTPAEHPQRQDSLLDQLRDLRILANENGMYDAADWLGRQVSNFNS